MTLTKKKLKELRDDALERAEKEYGTFNYRRLAKIPTVRRMDLSKGIYPVNLVGFRVTLNDGYQKHRFEYFYDDETGRFKA